MSEADASAVAFPVLTEAEMELVRERGERVTFRDGEVVLEAGTTDADFFVVEQGEIEILSPVGASGETGKARASRDGAHIVRHKSHQFVGDIDLLTRRAVIVRAVARGETVVTRVKGARFRDLIGVMPQLGEKLLAALVARRKMLAGANFVGVRVVGDAHCADTNLLREFLFKNFVPFAWLDSAKEEGRQLLREVGREGARLPLVEGPSGEVLERPSLAELAKCAGVVRSCPEKVYDLAIVGAGPAGMAAAVYAASEGLSTVILDCLGPGGQAAGSSLIENFVGFPSGLSGNELAARAVVQMLKFGVLLIVPAEVQRVELGDEIHKLHLKLGEVVSARVVLAATGVKWRPLDIPGVEKWERNGIYYSATSVEQRLCTGKPVVVVGAGNSGGQAAMYLSECSPKVYFVSHNEGIAKGMSQYLVKRIEANEKIEVIRNAEVTQVWGENAELAAAEVTDRATGEKRKIDVSAIFVFVGAKPKMEWLPPEVERDEAGYLVIGKRGPFWKVDRDPCTLETTAQRILAAGDLRAGSTKRVGFAVGDGSMAVTCVHKLIG